MGLYSRGENCSADDMGEGIVRRRSARLICCGVGSTSEKSRLGLLTALTKGLVGGRMTKLDERLLPRDGARALLCTSASELSNPAGSDGVRWKRLKVDWVAHDGGVSRDIDGGNLS